MNIHLNIKSLFVLISRNRKTKMMLVFLTLFLISFGFFFFYFLQDPLVFFEKKCYEKNDLIITDQTMGNLTNQGDNVLEKYNYYKENEVRRGDIVSVKLEGRNSFIRKVVAIPGDEIFFENNNLKTGKIIRRIVTNSKGEAYLFPDTIQEEFEGVVPSDSYLVLSDQISPGSFDSRQFGFVSKEQLSGKIIK